MGRRADPPAVVPPGTHPGSVLAPESNAIPDPSGKAGEPAAHDPAPGAIAGWTLRGRILRYADPDAAEPDTPVGGALVRLDLAPDPESSDPAPDFPVREVRSEPNGKFTLDSVPGKARYRLDVDADGLALRAMTLELPATVEGGAKDIPDIVLEEPAILVVHLRGPGGQPVEEGKVSAHLNEGFHSYDEPLYLWEDGCEAAHRGGGEYVLERAPRGSICVDATAPGFVDEWEIVPLPLDRALEILLRHGLRLTGTVRSSAGEPLEGAEVVAGSCDVTEKSVRTTADGRFELKDLPDSACLLTASADGFGSMKRQVETGLESIGFVLSPEAVLAGRVLSAESRQPLEGAEIRGEWEEQLVTTDSAGAFQVLKLPPGTYRPHVFHEDHVPRALDELELEEGERAEGIVVLLEKGLSVAGRVVGAGGHPLARASVSAHWSPSGEGSGPDIDQDALTDEDGAFTLAGLVEGEYTVQVLADGYCRLTRECRVPEDDAEGWTFALERGGSIRGTVLDPDGRPARRATVHLGCPQDDQSKVHVPVRHRNGSPADRLGRYRLEGLQAFERYCILVTDSESKLAPAWMCEIAVGPGEQVDLPEIRLRGGGSILGRVLDSAGHPVPGVKVNAEPDRARERRLRWKLVPEETTFSSFYRYPWIPDRETSTGPQGEYELRWLLGHYEIGVSLEGRVAPASKGVDVDEGLRLENVDFILPHGTAVSGRVIDPAGQPLRGAEVTVSKPCFVGASATTDAEGRFEVQGLGAGSGYITVSMSGHAARSTRCEIPSSGNVLSLDRQPVIAGRIAVSTGTERPPVCEVRTLTYSGFVYWGTSDGTGRFTVSAPPGVCFIGAEAEGFFCHPLKLDLKTGERREVVLTVERAGIVEVEIDFEGREEEEKLPDGTFVILERVGGQPASLREYVVYRDCTFAAVPPGEITLVACIPGHGIARKEGITVTAGETEEVRIEVTGAEGLFGIVTRRGEAVRGARVVARGTGKPATARTSSSGFYEIRDLDPGAYEVTFEDDSASGPPVRKRTTVLEGGARQLDAELGAALVSGLVTSGGEPVPGAKVIADNWEGKSWSEATTDAAGAWSLELEAPGEYVLQAFRGKEAVGPSRELVLEEAHAESRVDLEIEKE